MLRIVFYAILLYFLLMWNKKNIKNFYKNDIYIKKSCIFAASKKMNMTLEERKENFIRLSLKAHKGENLDYSKVVYVNNKTPVIIIDHDLRPDGTEYGEYTQLPLNHVKGMGHPEKSARRGGDKKKRKWDELLLEFRAAHHGENLEYPEQNYNNVNDKIRIIDHDLDENGVEYGEYWQDIHSHLRGCGHPRKGVDNRRKILASRKYYTNEGFKELCRKVWGDRYDLSLVEYEKNKRKITVICREHGPFRISCDNFKAGHGCPKCGDSIQVTTIYDTVGAYRKSSDLLKSHVEDEIAEIIKGCGLDIIRNLRSLIGGKEIDIYVPAKKIGIEYDSLYWHSEKNGKMRTYHLDKLERCNKNGIKLIQIFEDEWIYHKDIVVDKIKNLLGVSDMQRIGARKTVVNEISKEEAMAFLEKNHIQGYGSGSVHYGAFYNDEVIGVMSFKMEGAVENGQWELVRFSTKLGCCVQGLGSKMLKRFVTDYNPNEVKSFADRRWTLDKDSNMYTKIGFELDGVGSPDYRYVVGDERKHKFGFRKLKLYKKYGVPLSLTEKQMCDRLGFYRIWDCGLLKYVYNRKEK